MVTANFAANTNTRSQINPQTWLLRQAADSPSAPRHRLYCFCYAGGSANYFLPWQRHLAPGVQLCAVQLPGRGARFKETPFSSISPLIETLAQLIAGQDKTPFSFFGHSLGGLLAFELARYCKSHYLPMPERLIVSGCNGPQRLNPSKGLHRLPDEELIAALRDYNGTPPEILEYRELMELVLPAIRADFSLVETYRYLPLGALDIPITAFAGKRDSYNSVEQVEAWAMETNAAFRTHWFDGDHFFINGEIGDVMANINMELAAAGNAE